MIRILVNLILIVTLFLPMINAEIPIQYETPEKNNIFTIDTTEGVIVTTNKDVENPTFFSNKELIHSLPRMSAYEQTTLPLSIGEYDLEIRAAITQTYEWEGFKVIKDDQPLTFDYLSYNRDRKRIVFALKGADVIHLEKLTTTSPSVNEPITTYNAVLNDVHELNCYPSATTGKPLVFTCNVPNYPEKLVLSLDIGIVEQQPINVTSTRTQIPSTTNTSTTPPTQTNTPEEPVIEEIEPSEQPIPTADDITMIDLIPEQPETMTTTILLVSLLLFTTVFLILFVASHHKHQNKQLGKHHSQKNKQQPPKKEPEQQLPRYANINLEDKEKKI